MEISQIGWFTRETLNLELEWWLRGTPIYGNPHILLVLLSGDIHWYTTRGIKEWDILSHLRLQTPFQTEPAGGFLDFKQLLWRYWHHDLFMQMYIMGDRTIMKGRCLMKKMISNMSWKWRRKGDLLMERYWWIVCDFFLGTMGGDITNQQ